MGIRGCPKKLKEDYKKGLNKDTGNFGPISLISVSEKVTEWIPWSTITSQMKQVIRKSQHGFTKGKLWLKHLIISYDKVIFSACGENNALQFRPVGGERTDQTNPEGNGKQLLFKWATCHKWNSKSQYWAQHCLISS